MGADGGSFTNLREFIVKLKKRKGKQDPYVRAVESWTLCHLSSLPLIGHIVACRLGYLYLKEVVVQHLLEKRMPDECRHIRKLSDVVELHFSESKDFAIKINPSGDVSNLDECAFKRFVCPLSCEELNDKRRVCTLRTCGHVFSERALRDYAANSKECPVCSAAFDTKTDINVINPPENELETIRKNVFQEVDRERAARKAKKEAKKDKKRKKDTEAGKAEKKRKAVAAVNDDRVVQGSSAVQRIVAEVSQKAASQGDSKSSVLSSLLHKTKSDQKKSAEEMFARGNGGGALGI